MDRFWVKFAAMAPAPFNLGVGVTARDEADAIYLTRFVVGDREIASVGRLDDLALLDQKHVVPNMGNAFVRGIWWPRGYEQIGARAPGVGYLLTFHAIVGVGDPGGVHRRATILALDLNDAKGRFEAQFGVGTIVSLWVDDAFQRPR
jgi:hypothetical protein